MEESILNSTKEVLGLSSDDYGFDQDVILHINSAFGNLHQLGVGPDSGFSVLNDTHIWDDLELSTTQLNLVRQYVFLKTRQGFDPPSTSFHLEAANKQIAELEWRLNTEREVRRLEQLDTELL